MYSIDIIIVTFNSEKWILDCLNSIENQHYSLEKVNLIIVDNNSSDKTLALLENYKKNSLLNSFILKKLNKNLGFGKANNIGAQLSKNPYLFFLNIDTELQPDTLTNLMECVEASVEDIVAWEAKQAPYEHPKHYNPVTLEVTWASAAALMIKRQAFMEVEGFDEAIFMYGEDVDLSWRLRDKGYKILYVPSSVVNHYTGEKDKDAKVRELSNILSSDIFLRWRYGTKKQIVEGYFNLLLLLKQKSMLKQIFQRNFCPTLFKKYKKGPVVDRFIPYFNGLNYEIHRAGTKYTYIKLEQQPLVTIIVRTHKRPYTLYEAIQSIANQTYRHIEIIIIEDGKATAKRMLDKYFSHLNIIYHSTEESVGRTKAANKGLELARGKYINFLDDDDLFYADHIEVLCATLENNPEYKVAYSLAFETPIEVYSEEPYKYKELYYTKIFNSEYSHEELLVRNYLPIQTVMFKREIYEELGGLDESLEVLEDWDYWLKLSKKYPFYYIEKTTSIYRVPAHSQHMQIRRMKLLASSEKIHLRHGNGTIIKSKNYIGVKSKLKNLIFNLKLNRLGTLKMLSYKIGQTILRIAKE